MKRTSLLLVMALFLTGIYAEAAWRPVWHRMDEPFSVRVRQTDFFIFPNGEFDFNAHGRHYGQAGYLGVRIERDRVGKIRRVGNIFINYNRYGQVSRIGHLFIKYNRHGLVSKIGRKRIHYNSHGYFIVNANHRHKPGFVMGSGFYYGPAPTCNNQYEVYNTYNYDFGYDNNYGYNEFDDDDGEDDYYYRQPENKTKKKKAVVKNRRR